MNTNVVRNDGSWRPIIEWLDQLAEARLWRIPIGSHPPITRRDVDGALVLHDVDTGNVKGLVLKGEWVILSRGEFQLWSDGR